MKEICQKKHNERTLLYPPAKCKGFALLLLALRRLFRLVGWRRGTATLAFALLGHLDDLHAVVVVIVVIIVIIIVVVVVVVIVVIVVVVVKHRARA